MDTTKNKANANYNYLSKCDMQDHRMCGANIRSELRHTYTGTKFSVRYESFAGGNAFNVTWTDGPKASDVQTLLDKYAWKHDMGSDCWNTVPTEFNSQYGGVGYVTCSRTMSEEARQRIMTQNNINTNDREAAAEVWRIFCHTDLTHKNDNATRAGEGDDVLQIVDYSERAIALIGNTRAIKDELRSIGGRFNPHLTCGAGWIFSKTKRAELLKLLPQLKQ